MQLFLSKMADTYGTSGSVFMIMVLLQVGEGEYSSFKYKDNTPLKTTGFKSIGNIICGTKLECAVKCAYSPGCILVDLVAKDMYMHGTDSSINKTEINQYLISRYSSDQGTNSFKKKLSYYRQNHCFLMCANKDLGTGTESVVIGSMLTRKVEYTGLEYKETVYSFTYDPKSMFIFLSLDDGIYKQALERTAPRDRLVKDHYGHAKNMHVFKDKIYCLYPISHIGAIYHHSTSPRTNQKRNQSLTVWHKRYSATIDIMSGHVDLLCWIEQLRKRCDLYCSQLPVKKIEYIPGEHTYLSTMFVLRESSMLISATVKLSGRFVIRKYDAKTLKRLCEKEEQFHCNVLVNIVRINGNMVYSNCIGSNKLEARRISFQNCAIENKAMVIKYPTKAEFGIMSHIMYSFL